MAAPFYPGDTVDNTTQVLPDTHEPSLTSVSKSFGLLPVRTNYIGYQEVEAFPSNEYTELNNHFQGMKRLQDGRHVVISGGSKKDKKANLIVCRAEYYAIRPNSSELYSSVRIESAIGSNLVVNRNLPQQDKLVGIFQINNNLGNDDASEFWHAGGMDTCGNILAVSLENAKDQESWIRFYDFTDAENPQKIDNTDFKIKGNSGGIALTKRLDNRFICASWTDSDDGPDRFDFYISKNPDDLSSWNEKITYEYRRLTPEDNLNPKFQSINFVRQKDGKLFLIGTENSNKFAPVLKGKDRAHLYEVTFFENHDNEAQFYLTKIAQKDFEGGGSYANFGAAAGVYVNNADKMALYSAHHWRSEGIIKIGEYWPVLEPNEEKITFKRDLVIELYEHRHFNGKVLRIFGERFSKLRNFNKAIVEDSSFNDKVSSARILLPSGYKLVLYEDEDYSGQTLSIPGNGHFQEFIQFPNFDNKVTSCRIEVDDD